MFITPNTGICSIDLVIAIRSFSKQINCLLAVVTFAANTAWFVTNPFIALS